MKYCGRHKIIITKPNHTDKTGVKWSIFRNTWASNSTNFKKTKKYFTWMTATILKLLKIVSKVLKVLPPVGELVHFLNCLRIADLKLVAKDFCYSRITLTGATFFLLAYHWNFSNEVIIKLNSPAKQNSSSPEGLIVL